MVGDHAVIPFSAFCKTIKNKSNRIRKGTKARRSDSAFVPRPVIEKIVEVNG